MSKKDLSERDICTKFITPAIQQAGWDIHSQIREEVGFTKGRIIVRGKPVTRGKAKRAEKHRIVTKTDEVLALCDALGNRLNATATTRRQLLEATLHEALEGVLEHSGRSDGG